MVYGKEIVVETKGFSDIKDITAGVNNIIEESRIKNGLAGIFVIGSTASVTTMEFEPSLVEDIRDQLEEFVSKDKIIDKVFYFYYSECNVIYE